MWIRIRIRNTVYKYSWPDGPVVWEAEDALNGVDGEDDGLWLEPGPGHVDLQLVNVTCNHQHSLQTALLENPACLL
jgi:hypothetical protein